MPTSEPDSSLAASFDLLGNETRLGIVQALLAAEPEPLRFSDIRDEVGVRDTGRFNYHLGRLRGTLVEKSDEGYVLTPEGRRLGGVFGEPATAPS
jgi:hypothetical protein